MSLEELLQLLTSELDRPVSEAEVLSNTCDSLEFFQVIVTLQDRMDKEYKETSFIGKTVAQIHELL